MFFKKNTKFHNYLIWLQGKYDDEINNRNVAIHQNAMNSLNDKKSNKKTYDGLLYECEKDKLLFKAKLEVVKDIIEKFENR